MYVDIRDYGNSNSWLPASSARLRLATRTAAIDRILDRPSPPVLAFPSRPHPYLLPSPNISRFGNHSFVMRATKSTKKNICRLGTVVSPLTAGRSVRVCVGQHVRVRDSHGDVFSFTRSVGCRLDEKLVGSLAQFDATNHISITRGQQTATFQTPDREQHTIRGHRKALSVCSCLVTLGNWKGKIAFEASNPWIYAACKVQRFFVRQQISMHGSVGQLNPLRAGKDHKNYIIVIKIILVPGIQYR